MSSGSRPGSGTRQDDTGEQPHPGQVETTRTETTRGRAPNVWVYDGMAYDLSDWIAEHPGGAFFIGRTRNRDITSIVGSYHSDPDKVARMLRRYALGRPATPADVHPKNNAPPFLFKDDFNAWRDTPQYHFDVKSDLLHRVKKKLKDPAMAARLRRLDLAFNVVVAVLLVCYFAVQAVRLTEPRWMPLPAFVIAMVMLRVSMAAFGHYAIHRAQRGANRFLCNAFDLNYVALTLVTADGHALLHHPHTQSEVDIKKNVFTWMMELPRLYRVPIHTVHKFGHLLTGMAVRIVDIVRIVKKMGPEDLYGTRRGAAVHLAGATTVRLLLIGELVVFILAGDFWAWALQFVATVWVSTFLIVSSHDFEDESEDGADVDADADAEGGADKPAGSGDWGVDQIECSYDLTVVGNRYVDCFLSAGLSSHRVHHLLPYQRSGFANIATEDLVRAEAAEFGVEWLRSKNFLTDRLPKLCRTYLLSRSRQAQQGGWSGVREHCSPAAFKTSAEYVLGGFIGLGSV